MFDKLFHESLAYLPDFQVDAAHLDQSCELVETMCLTDGAVVRLPFHLARMQAACQVLGWRDISEDLPELWAATSASTLR